RRSGPRSRSATNGNPWLPKSQLCARWAGRSGRLPSPPVTHRPDWHDRDTEAITAQRRPPERESTDRPVSDTEIVSFEPATGAELWRGAIGSVDEIVARARKAWPQWAAQPVAR